VIRDHHEYAQPSPVKAGLWFAWVDPKQSNCLLCGGRERLFYVESDETRKVPAAVGGEFASEWFVTRPWMALFCPEMSSIIFLGRTICLFS
jgi:hypothetical protein